VQKLGKALWAVAGEIMEEEGGRLRLPSLGDGAEQLALGH